MDSKTKRKNLLDNEFNKQLNYFNICAITFLTILFTIIWSGILKEITADVLFTTALINTLIFSMLLFLIRKKTNGITLAIKRI